LMLSMLRTTFAALITSQSQAASCLTALLCKDLNEFAFCRANVHTFIISLASLDKSFALKLVEPNDHMLWLSWISPALLMVSLKNSADDFFLKIFYLCAPMVGKLCFILFLVITMIDGFIRKIIYHERWQNKVALYSPCCTFSDKKTSCNMLPCR
jgi:hypothetical protein